jgi:threonyl-tRNA synthetase
MPTITFPDRKQRSFDAPVTGLEIAQGISPSLAKKSVVIKVNGEAWDLTRPIVADARVELVTRDSPEALEVFRHDAAHVLAQAVQESFPGTQITFGPATESGFYYDFVRDEPFTEADLEKIEARMKEIVKRDLPIRREIWDRAQAIEHFRKAGEKYKAEWIAEGIAPDAEISVYRQGDQWLDLCTGPHLPSTGKLGTAFKLMKVSGAYWRGDRNNAQLQRIYGTAFATEQELKDYLKALEEAEKRDHRKLGRRLDFFHMQEESPGMVFWHDKGWLIYTEIQNYLRKLLREHGYQEVRTPEIVSRSLWEKSGHWEKFREEMFTTSSEEREFAVKPMNCPCHVQIYNHGLRSYRDLPLRMAEFGSCHRNEPSGALHGLMRVRAFTQDDAHIFCTEEQILPEVSAFIDLLFRVYRDFGFEDVQIKLSTRPEKRVGADEVWDRAEKALADVLDQKGIQWQLQPGEGAFYGPKVEFSLKDSIGRVWQCGTVQLDFSMPARLGAEYVAEDNSRKVPVMLHRAILGSLERFIGILIEHHAGAMPLWLAPVHAVILNITDRQVDYAREVCRNLQSRGLRVEIDLRNEKIGYKIREHTIQKLPYLIVVGDQEVESKTVAVRTRGGEDRGSMSIPELADSLAAEIASRGR